MSNIIIENFAIAAWILLVIWVIFYCIKYFVRTFKTKKFSLRYFFNDFRQKMWITIGLGVFFFGLYFAIVFLGAMTVNSQTKLDFFFLVYKNPIAFIYLGLLLFISISLTIYLARIVIKHLYNSRTK